MGRQGLELEEEQRLVIESGKVGNAEKEKAGIFLSSSLAALQSAQVSFAPTPKPSAPSRPLVAI